MNEKKVLMLIFGIVVLVAVIGLILLYQSEKTGEFKIRMPTDIRTGKAIKKTIVREPKEKELVKVDKPKEYDPCCLWMDKGMSFHISKAAAKYMGFSRSKVGSSELFDKTDLVFVKKPYFYDEPLKCVKGGTLKKPTDGEALCVETYKGKPLPLEARAGLLCIDKQWWLAGEVCGVGGYGKELGVPEPPPMPD